MVPEPVTHPQAAAGRARGRFLSCPAMMHAERSSVPAHSTASLSPSRRSGRESEPPPTEPAQRTPSTPPVAAATTDPTTESPIGNDSAHPSTPAPQHPSTPAPRPGAVSGEKAPENAGSIERLVISPGEMEPSGTPPIAGVRPVSPTSETPPVEVRGRKYLTVEEGAVARRFPVGQVRLAPGSGRTRGGSVVEETLECADGQEEPPGSAGQRDEAEALVEGLRARPWAPRCGCRQGGGGFGDERPARFVSGCAPLVGSIKPCASTRAVCVGCGRRPRRGAGGAAVDPQPPRCRGGAAR